MITVPNIFQNQNGPIPLSQLDQNFSRIAAGAVTTPEISGAGGAGATDDTAAMQTAVNSGAASLYLGGTYMVSGIVITSPIILWGPGTVKRTTVGSQPILTISSSNVTVDGITFVGASFNTKIPTTTAADQGIVAQPVALTSVAPLTHITVRRCTVNGFAGTGIQVSYATVCDIDNNVVQYCGYAGIYAGSVIDSQITRNKVAFIDATVNALVNFYGITMTRDASVTTTVAARCTNIIVTENIVHDVPGWTGIDMHAGKDIVVGHNRVYFCKNGITAQYDDSAGGNPNKQPSDDILINDNIVEGNATISTAQIGIASLGLTALPNNRVTIADNLLLGCGNYTSATGAVYVSSTNYGIVRNNTMNQCIRQGIGLDGTSKFCTIEDNTIDGVTDGSSGGSYMNIVTGNLTNCFVRANVMANNTGNASYTPAIGILYDAANTALVFSRNRIVTLSGVQYILKIAGSANNYPELGWELETETIKFNFTTAGAGGLAPYEQIADKSGSFRRLPFRGTNEIVFENIYIAEKSGSAPPLYFITNPLKVYTPWVYRADGVNTDAGVVLTGVTYSISGVFWTQ